MIFSLNAGFLGSLCLSLSLSRLLACRTPEALDDQLERSACTLQAFKGFGGASRLVVAKPGAKGAEKHIFLIDSSRGGGPHDGCPAQAQAAPRALFLLHFLFCLFLLRLPFGLPYHTIPLTGKAPFFSHLTTLTAGKAKTFKPHESMPSSAHGFSLVQTPEALTQVRVLVLAMQTKRRLPGQVQAQ